MHILTDYIHQALILAEYDKLEDSSFAGRIPGFAGVVAFASTLRECEDQLQSVLEDWILLGLKLGHELPELTEINMNGEIRRDQMAAL